MAIPHEAGVSPSSVFNPHAWALKAQCRTEIAALKPGNALTDENGAPECHAACTLLGNQQAARDRLSFVAEPAAARLPGLSSGDRGTPTGRHAVSIQRYNAGERSPAPHVRSGNWFPLESLRQSG
jgi:hypothetical protein